MPKVDVTICGNLKARQLDNNKLRDIEKVLSANKKTYNKKSVSSLAKTKPSELGETLLAVGGDGTANLVANVAIKNNRKLAVYAQGTFNHFAKDMNLPLDMQAVVEIAGNDRVSKIDAVLMNETYFLNNSVIGFYPHIVEKRELMQKRVGKWLALMFAICSIIFKIRRHRLEIVMDNKPKLIRSSLLVISNNKYDLGKFGLAQRHNLNRGKLYIYVLRHKSLIKMFGVSLRLLLGKTTSRDFDQYSARIVMVNYNKKQLKVAIDGEVGRYNTPVKYQIKPKILRVHK